MAIDYGGGGQVQTTVANSEGGCNQSISKIEWVERYWLRGLIMVMFTSALISCYYFE
uniref:Uncharacterized protein n=1 Tax=Anguilla anguilla TaxID=7936 RepID=A0A0E9S3S2_ANGAN